MPKRASQFASHRKATMVSHITSDRMGPVLPYLTTVARLTCARVRLQTVFDDTRKVLVAPVQTWQLHLAGAGDLLAPIVTNWVNGRALRIGG